MKFNTKLRLDYFSVNVSILAVVFHQKISKHQQFQAKLFFFEICWEIQQLVRKRSQKNK